MSDKPWHELTLAEQLESIRQRMEGVTEEEVLEALRDDDDDETDSDSAQSFPPAIGARGHNHGESTRHASVSTPTA